MFDQLNPYFLKRSKGELALLNNIMDMFMAGTETTSSAILWSILFLLHHPECQEKLFSEIESFIGKDRPPSFEDRSKMHYTNAFILESYRVACFVPMSVFQWSTKDISFKNYVIPKDTMLISSLYHVMFNPEYFPEPETFRPERFIDENTGRFVKDERVVNFGVGKRYCLGKSLADKEYFLFLTGLMQAFKFEKVPDTKLPSYKIADVPVPGLTRNVPHFEVILQPRK